MIETAVWDSKNFGIKIGNYSPQRPLTKESLLQDINLARAEGYDLLYLKNVELPEPWLDENIILADRKVIYSQTIENTTNSPVPDVVSILHEPLTDVLLELAFESGKWSRFKLDTNFPPHVFSSLYTAWIMKSLKGEIASDVLAFKADHSYKGILTYLEKDSDMEIGLVAVDSQAAGHGIGTQMMKAFLAKCTKGKTIRVATQSHNKPACSFYQKNGFAVESINNIYHIWTRRQQRP